VLLLPQVTCNVHGVAAAFLDIGRAKAAKPPPGQHRFTKVSQAAVRLLNYGLLLLLLPAWQHRFTKVSLHRFLYMSSAGRCATRPAPLHKGHSTHSASLLRLLCSLPGVGWLVQSGCVYVKGKVTPYS
jgi:hypothetical protein